MAHVHIKLHAPHLARCVTVRMKWDCLPVCAPVEMQAPTFASFILYKYTLYKYTNASDVTLQRYRYH